MKSLVKYSLILMLIVSGNINAQELPDRIRNTEVHLGGGFQQLLHVGGRFRIDTFLMLETGVGYFQYDESPLNAFSLGLTAIPRAAQRDPGFIYTLLYTLWYSDDINWRSGFVHMVSGNVGWISQHSAGFSFLVRLGGGVAIEDYEKVDPDSGFIYSYEHKYFWPNLDITFGYAF